MITYEKKATYPTRLTDDELGNLFEDFKNADEIYKPIVREQIITHNMGLVYYMANNIQSTHNILMDYDDLVSVGMVGLIKAVDNFEPSKGFKFSTFATLIIKREIMREWYRKEKKHAQNTSLNSILHIDDNGDDFTWEDVLSISESDAYEEVYKRDDESLITYLLNNLSESERKIVSLAYGVQTSNKYTQTVVAEMMGCSQAQVCRVLKKSLSKMRGMIERKE